MRSVRNRPLLKDFVYAGRVWLTKAVAFAMAVDLTLSFQISLAVLTLECLLFAAVVLHSPDNAPGWHAGVARWFGYFFLFQGLGALFLCLSEIFYPGYFCLYLAVMAVVWIGLAVATCIPASVAVAFPETSEARFKSTAGPTFVGVTIVVLCAFVLSSRFKATPDIPYVNGGLRRDLLGAMAGAAAVIGIATGIRMARGLKGSNGAFILCAALVLAALFGIVWLFLEPLCREKADANSKVVFPASCPLPSAFDHNAMLTAILIVSNVLGAEGVLRLMQAGDGVLGYTAIQA